MDSFKTLETLLTAYGFGKIIRKSKNMHLNSMIKFYGCIIYKWESNDKLLIICNIFSGCFMESVAKGLNYKTNVYK